MDYKCEITWYKFPLMLVHKLR